MKGLLSDALRHVESMNDADMTLAMECAVAAGEFIREGWEGELTSLGVKEKGVGDLVSVVDVKAETAVLNLLKQR